MCNICLPKTIRYCWEKIRRPKIGGIYHIYGFPSNCWTNWLYIWKKVNSEHYLTIYTKITWKWITDLNVKVHVINLTGENIHNVVVTKISFLKKILIFNGRIIVLKYCIGFCHTSKWISHMYTNVPSLLNLSSTSHPIPLQNFLNKQIIEEKVGKLDFFKIRTSDFWKILLRKFFKKTKPICRLRKNKAIHISHNRLESLKEHVKVYLYHQSLESFEQTQKVPMQKKGLLYLTTSQLKLLNVKSVINRREKDWLRNFSQHIYWQTL